MPWESLKPCENEEAHAHVLHQGPPTFDDWSVTKERAVTDGEEPGEGSAAQKCKARSPEGLPSLAHLGHLHQTQWFTLPREPRPASDRWPIRRPACIGSLGLKLSAPPDFLAG